MAEKVISEHDTNMFFPTDNNTEINSTCVNNHNIKFNENTPNYTNETALTSSHTTSECTPKRRKTDPVWAFIDDINNKHTCKLCHKEYSKGTGITTIKGHFKHDHSDVPFLQTDLIEPYGKKDEEKVMHLIELLIRWIITDQQAFSVVENEDFCAFIKELDQKFRLPTRQSISESIIDLYNNQKQMLRTFLMTMQNKFTITTNVWSSCTNLGYLAIMLHWINENWSSSKILLDIVPLHERHTGS
jgi:hypothetical protein